MAEREVARILDYRQHIFPLEHTVKPLLLATQRKRATSVVALAVTFLICALVVFFLIDFIVQESFKFTENWKDSTVFPYPVSPITFFITVIYDIINGPILIHQLKSIVYLHFLTLYLMAFSWSKIPSRTPHYIWWSGATGFWDKWAYTEIPWWIPCTSQTGMWANSTKNLLLQVFPSSRSIYPSKHRHTKESSLLTHECSQPWSPKAQESNSENPNGIRWTEEGNNSDISDLFNPKRHFRYLKLKQYLIP